ncbi:ABC transporter substrate-binding protein [Lutispora saccharofermentans]|uniref:ABC transporter substrate-binding protein n=1 Tax=Lutispora saccharofermentans TaxID=3024236 RepID=A0ABT1NGE1_9FIRM|nr:ABC transporter substrate-binding protein [Lutispora saccharofermentans]MCQ1528916.1 ABC transporter substrate-binding protein [Lutispora saccharofermentans]
MKKTRIISCLLLVVMLFTLTACAGQEAQSTNGNSTGSTGEEASSAKKRDDLVIGIQKFSPTLDTTKTADIMLPQFQIFDGLVRDYNGEIVPALAKSWVFADDAKSITFKLRPSTKFHNGDPITAEDVVFSINRAAASPFVTIMASAIDKAEKIDEQTVLVNFKYPYGPGLKYFTTTALYIMNKKAIEADEDGYGKNPVGSGPYVLKEWIPGEKIVMEAFSGYYAGEPAIKKITYIQIPDPSTLLIALEKGEIDIIDSNTPEEARQSLIDNKKLQYAECDSNAFLNIMFNNTKGPFADKRVREAVSYAVDRQELIDGAKNGMAAPLEAALLTSCPEYPVDFKANPYDLEKAKALLTEAGYPDGFTVKMKTIDSPTYSKPTEIIQAQLKKIGINIEIEIMERGKYMDDVTNKGDFDITFWAIVAKVPDADFCQYSFFHSENLKGKGNYMGINNPELDKLLSEGRACLDLEKRKEIYAKACEIIKEETMLVPLFMAKRTLAANTNLTGLELRPDNLRRYIYADWK